MSINNRTALDIALISSVREGKIRELKICLSNPFVNVSKFNNLALILAINTNNLETIKLLLDDPSMRLPPKPIPMKDIILSSLLNFKDPSIDRRLCKLYKKHNYNFNILLITSMLCANVDMVERI